MKKVRNLILIATLFITFLTYGSATYAAVVDSKRSEAVVGFYNRDSLSSNDINDFLRKDYVINPSKNINYFDKDRITSYPKTGLENPKYLVIIGLAITVSTTIIYLEKKKASGEK
ncbi:hypothetical protein BH746_11755 [Enterococcus faecalis]|uniref:hypothetical protein n=1 Tax=Enterococcus faecalis TaxID=1351 RepID=UPI0009BEB72C|nr:hypothetical protein [Enterococcus faecalis]OQO72570.1 hypothetical protein BH746_11755 [Enterococcus faecalis]